MQMGLQKSKGNKMAAWIDTKLDWWPKDSSKGVV
jgi:hypothetical protein